MAEEGRRRGERRQAEVGLGVEGVDDVADEKDPEEDGLVWGSAVSEVFIIYSFEYFFGGRGVE